MYVPNCFESTGTRFQVSMKGRTGTVPGMVSVLLPVL